MNKKSRTLHLLKYLHENTDENHPVSLKEIIEHLTSQGFTAHRTTVNSDIEHLCDIGVDVVTVRSSPNRYYVGERILEPHELKMLVDAVTSSKFITAKKSKELIEKISRLTSKHIAEELCCDNRLNSVIKPLNEKIYYSIDTIQNAIHKKSWIDFKYHEYTPEKKLRHKNNGYVYKVCPYTTFWRDDHYYLLAYSDKHEKMVAFRIDRIDKAKISYEEWLAPPPGFDSSDYINKMFEMFDGPLMTVELKCKNRFMDVIVDKFGKGVEVAPYDDEHFKVTTEVHISPRFYGWVFGFLGDIEIISPAEIRSEYAESAKKAMFFEELSV